MVYLLHFARKLGRVQHYVGYTTDETTLPKRMHAHRTGRGGRLPNAMRLHGIDFEIARIWPDGNQAFERRLKKTRHHPSLCPICQPEWRKQATDKDRARRHRRETQAWSKRMAETARQLDSVL